MIKDGEEKMLFDLVEAPTLKMNVTFPPQSASNQSLSAEKGSNLTITFNFTSNPMPSSVSWLVTIPEVVRMDKYEQLREEIFAELDEAGDNGNATNSSSIIELTPGKLVYRGKKPLNVPIINATAISIVPFFAFQIVKDFCTS